MILGQASHKIFVLASAGHRCVHDSLAFVITRWPGDYLHCPISVFMPLGPTRSRDACKMGGASVILIGRGIEAYRGKGSYYSVYKTDSLLKVSNIHKYPFRHRSLYTKLKLNN